MVKVSILYKDELLPTVIEFEDNEQAKRFVESEKESNPNYSSHMLIAILGRTMSITPVNDDAEEENT